MAASSISQDSNAPGWAVEPEVDSSVANQPRDHSKAPTAEDVCRICQGDSPLNEHLHAFGDKEHKPASEVLFPQMEKQERDACDHPHNKRCEGLCVPWQGKETCFCHSSFCAPTVHTTHSHHIDVLTMQTASSPNHTLETHLSQPGTMPSETAMQNEPLSNNAQCKKKKEQTTRPCLARSMHI
jgi:hypothetical protein